VGSLAGGQVPASSAWFKARAFADQASAGSEAEKTCNTESKGLQTFQSAVLAI